MSMITKRILAIVLSIVMLTGMLPVGALAAEGEGAQQVSQETILTEPGEGVSEGTEEGNLTDDIVIDSDEDDAVIDNGEDDAVIDNGEDDAVIDNGEDDAVIDNGEDDTVIDSGEDDTVIDNGEDDDTVTDEGEYGIALAEEEIEAYADGVIDAAIFCSDVHRNSSAVTTVLNGIKAADAAFNPSTVSFVGDTQTSASSVTAAVQKVYSGVQCIYAFGNHDDEGNFGIADFTGLIYGNSTTNYYIYTISESSMGSSSPDTSGFTGTVAGLDKTKPLFIISHLPLHARRGDSDGAPAWYEAISAAAEQMDIAFFWAHNHTGETSVDRDAYYVAKDGFETINIENGDKNIVPNFTYLNAGYLAPSNNDAARKNVATAVRIYEDSINFTVYNANGELTGSYAVNETVLREFAQSEPEVPEVPEVTGPVEKTDEASGIVVVAPGLTGLTVTTVEADAPAYEAVAGLMSNCVGYNIELEGYVDGNLATVTLPIPEGVNNPVVYYVSDDCETVTNMNAVKGDGVVTFETDHFSTYIVGEAAKIEVPEKETASGSGTTTTTTTKTVYVLTSSISSGKSYLIANSNSASTTTRYLLKNNNGSVAATGVTIKSGDVDGDGDNETYIELDNATNELWTTSAAIGSSTTSTLQNGRYYLYVSSNGSLGLEDSTGNYTNWRLGSNKLYRYRNNYTYYYLRYNRGWTTTSQSNDATNVYFYVPTEIEVETTTTVTGKYSIAGNPAEVTKVVENGTTAELGSTLTFTPSSGTPTTTDTSTTATYTKVEGGDPNGIIDRINGNTITFTGKYGTALVKVSYTTNFGDVTNYITVKATEPTYTVDITSGENVVTDTTISQKGVVAGMTLQLGTKVTYTTTEGTNDVTGGTFEWDIPEEYQYIATIDENGLVTFTGESGGFYVMVTFTDANGKSHPAVGVNISATTSQHSVPSDGTNDFPEYPNEGAIRFDKTATAVGNFSETGITQVELSMTGVPFVTGSELDVVLMLDQSTSMNDSRIKATVAAAKAFIQSIVINEDGTFNKNRVYVGYFNGAKTYDITDNNNIGGDLASIDSQTELDRLFASIDGKFNGSPSTTGTDYAVALKKCYDRLNIAKTDGTGNERQQFCVFMSDGVPTTYQTGANTMHGTSGSTSDGYSDMKPMFTGTNYDTRSNSYTYEYYSTQMKKAGVTVYTVGLGLQATNSAWSGASAVQCLNAASILLNDISGPAGETTQPDAKNTKTLSKKNNYFFSVADANAATEMSKVFANIAMKILQAATDVTVEDKITDEYTMIFDIPTGEKSITGVTNDFYIEFLQYTLDEDHERTNEVTSVTKLYLKKTNGVYSAASDKNGAAYAAPVFENKTIGDKGTLYFWTTDKDYAGQAAVTYRSGNTTYYFIPYGMDAEDDAYVAASWFNMTSGGYANGTVDSETNMSDNLVIATPYFVYNAGTKMLYWTVDKLDTTEYALSYFLYLDDSATEVGTEDEISAGTYPTNEYAYITYTNFRGNECRQEFPEPQLTWSGAQVSYVFYLVNPAGQPINKSGQVVDFANATFITDIYTTSVVWNKGEDGQITGDSNLSIDWLAEELLPDDYMVYDENAGYELHVYGDTTGASIFDYFIISGSEKTNIASSLNNRLENVNATSSSVSVETTKVYNTKAGDKYDDYGVYTSKSTDAYNGEIVLNNFDFANTTVAFAVVWQPALMPDVVVVDYGLDVLINVVQNDLMQNTVTGIGIGDDAYGNVAMNTGVADSSKLGNGEQVIDGNTISIENENQIRFHQGDMEFKNSVVFYYESPVQFYEDSNPKEGYMYSSVTVIPATTIYYEDTFLTLESYSKGTDGNFGKDRNSKWSVDGRTVNATQAQDRPGESQISAALDADNNYGYDAAYKTMSTHSLGSAAKITVDASTRGEATFTFWGTGFDVIGLTSDDTGTITVQVYKGSEAAGTAVRSTIVDTYYGMEEDGTLSVNSPDTLYQVPEIKIFGLDYAQYTVKITAGYNTFFDHQENSTSYDLYLDAIRIYDPTGNEDETALDAYIKDGEAYPVYEELRNNIIDASEYTVTENEDGTVTVTGKDLSGAIFIDSNDGVTSIADYVSYGPNNELYLANGQVIAFNVEITETVADVQLGIKVANGGTVTYKINGTSYTTESATDLYYSILEHAKAGTVIIENISGGILSLTNIKVTYVAETTTNGLMRMNAESVGYALMSLRSAPVVDETPDVTEPEETEPEATEPEATEPEETEPEATEPEETEPEASEPETTEPEETEPEATEPETTVPEENKPGNGNNQIGNIVQAVVKTVVNVVKNILNNLFGGWFR